MLAAVHDSSLLTLAVASAGGDGIEQHMYRTAIQGARASSGVHTPSRSKRRERSRYGPNTHKGRKKKACRCNGGAVRLLPRSICSIRAGDVVFSPQGLTAAHAGRKGD